MSSSRSSSSESDSSASGDISNFRADTFIPVGLDNLKGENNCWLNALLQMCLNIPVLYDTLMSLPASEFAVLHYFMEDYRRFRDSLKQPWQEYKEKQVRPVFGSSQVIRQFFQHQLHVAHGQKQEDAHDMLQKLLNGVEEVSKTTRQYHPLFAPVKIETEYKPLKPSTEIADPERIKISLTNPKHNRAYPMLNEQTSSRHQEHPDFQILLDLPRKPQFYQQFRYRTANGNNSNNNSRQDEPYNYDLFEYLMEQYFMQKSSEDNQFESFRILRPPECRQSFHNRACHNKRHSYDLWDYGVVQIKKMFGQAPQYLFVNLKRFYYESNHAKIQSKIEHPINIPDKFTLQTRNMGKIGDYTNHTFRLLAFITHKGTSVGNGHYVEYHMSGFDWYKCDDEQVTVIPPREVREGLKQSYILFYKLTDD